MTNRNAIAFLKLCALAFFSLAMLLSAIAIALDAL
jgi:hypothetical protein